MRTLPLKHSLNALSSAILCLALAVPSFVQAASLGKMNVMSKLGAPLLAEIEVLNLSADEEALITSRIASVETFKLAGIDFNPALSSVRTTLSKDNGKNLLILSSSMAVTEPLMDVLVEINWPTGRLVREYTVLLDPSDLQGKNASFALQPAPQGDVSAAATVNPPAATVAISGALAAGLASGADGVAQAATLKTSSYTVLAGETLYAVASRVSNGKPGNLSAVLANIYRNNPEAFVAGDVNRMKAGSVLQVPDNLENVAIGFEPAVKTVNFSTPSFSAYRQKVAQSTQAAPRSTQAQATRKKRQLTAKVLDQTAPEIAKDRLKVAGSATVLAAGASGALAKPPKSASKMQDKLQAEDAVAKERALSEEAARKLSLEKNNAELKKALALKNDKLTALTSPAVSAATAPAQAIVAPQKQTGAPSVAAQTSVAVAPLPPTVTPVVAPAVTPVPTPAPSAQPPAVPKPLAKTPVLLPPALSESAWYENIDPFMLGGLGGVLVLGSGLVLMRNRKKKLDNDFADHTGQSDTANNSLLTGDASHAMFTQHSEFSSNFSPANAGIDAAEVDPIAEADVYMQYGREAHAIEILKDSLNHDARNVPVRLKLMEVYAKVQNFSAMEAQAKELQKITAGKGADWEQAQAIGRVADVKNPLYGAVSRQGAPSFVRTNMMPVAGVGRALPASLSDADFSTPTAIGDVPIKLQTEPAVKPQSGNVKNLSNLNFATTLPMPDYKPNAQANSGVPSALNVALDFDVSAPTGMTPTRIVPPAAKPVPDASMIDFKLSSFDLGSSAANPVAQATAKPVSKPSMPVMPKPTTTIDNDGFGKSLNGAQEFNTKLNLAEAYAEIGDKDGAKELLNEVIASGNTGAATQAKTMLAKL